MGRFKYISPKISGSSKLFNYNEYVAISENNKLYMVLSYNKFIKDDTCMPSIIDVAYPISHIEKTLSGRIVIFYKNNHQVFSREMEKTMSGKIYVKTFNGVTWLMKKHARPFIPQGHPEFDLLECLFDSSSSSSSSAFFTSSSIPTAYESKEVDSSIHISSI